MKMTYRTEGETDVIELEYSIFELDKIKYAIESIRRIADVKIETTGFFLKRMEIKGTPEQIKIAGKALRRRYHH
ncbi:tryptophan synthase subunit alpha [Morganella morganii]|uniref:tryptophan synthase subunit alpha n=1 Tax=Morganella morganii TaxID=582 RepID=UPI0034E44F8C